MRNLQKILALALALIMSFSLVVTANAAFSDEADINETYNESVNVLAQLEVFRGYTDGSYKPQDSITRAEVAAIIYRIATGDVSDSQVSLYSDWNRFKDVASGSWYAGYVNYCANAEYIKGYEDGSFRPNNNVTGYEALAMILRAVGYGKMDEFVGSNWAVNTAARANTLKISKNVTAALLGSPASREVVAELLFRSILVPTVTYNNAFGYQETDTTLGYDSFKLEAIEGVVVANEFANLYDTQVLAEGKTNLELAKDDVRSLNITSQVTDIGESRYAYVSGSTVYALENTGNNVVFEPEQGKKTDISTDRKFSDASGLSKADDTEFYLNFGREGNFTCDYRLEFSVTFKHADAEEAFNDFVDISVRAAEADSEYIVKDSDGNKITLGDKTNYEDVANYGALYAGGVTYTKIIRANDKIPADDLKVIEGIFAAADNEDDESALTKNWVTGDVYVGTKSTNDEENKKERDISNDISFRKFKAEYINSEIWDQDIENSKNGEWLKIVDNNNDGKAEYAFLTNFWLDKAVSSYTKSGKTILEYRYLDVEEREDDDGIIVYEDEIAVGDIVLYTDIDNKIIIKKADTTKATINSVSFKDETAAATDGTVYKQSGIYNKTRLDELLTNMDENVEYNLYFDKYGYVRAYEPAEGTNYGLLTELYYSRGQNGQYVTNARLTAELKAGKEAVEEFDVVNKNNNHFLLDIDNDDAVEDWSDLHGVLTGTEGYLNVYNVAKSDEIVLQPALRHLGLNSRYEGQDRDDDAIFFNAATNVARYVKTADGEIRITSAAEFFTNEKGERMYYVDDVGGKKDLLGTDHDGDETKPAYAIDYINLDPDQNIAKKASRFEIEETDYAANSVYVNAVDDTEFYIVTPEKISYFVGYENVPAIEGEDIRAAYAVAKNTEYDSNKKDYWVADVIVIEVSEFNKTFDSIALGYYNPYQTSSRVKAVNTLNSESEKADIEMIPTEKDWGTQWKDFGFYEVADSKMDGESLMADTIRQISWNEGALVNTDFSEFGIYAGYVRRVNEVNERGRYIDVDKDNDSDATDGSRLKTAGAELFAIGSGSNGTSDKYRTEPLHLANTDERSDIKSGHRILWVEDKAGNVAYIVNVDYVDGSWCAPAWLADAKPAIGLWAEVMAEQMYHANAADTSTEIKLTEMTVKGVKVIEDGKVLENVSLTNTQATDSSTLVDWSLKTDAEVVTVVMNGTPASKTVVDGAAATTDKTNLTRDGATSVKFTVTLTKGDESKTINIEVPINKANTNASLKDLTIKGVAVLKDGKLAPGATLAADSGDGSAAGASIKYEIEVPLNNAMSTTIDQFVYVATSALNSRAPITDNKSTVSGWDTTYANSKAAFNDTNGGAVKFHATAEDGATALYYEIAVTVGDGVTIKSGTNYAASPTNTGEFAIEDADGTAVDDTTGVKVVSDVAFKFTVTTINTESETGVTYKIGASGTATAAKKNNDGTYEIPVDALAKAFEDSEDIVIDVETATSREVLAANAGTVWYGETADDLKALGDTAGQGVTLLQGEKLTIWVRSGTVTVNNGATVSAVPTGNIGQFEKWIIDTTSATGDIIVTVTT